MNRNLQKYLKKIIKEEISSLEREKIANLKSGEVLTVYHGTPLFRLPDLINGFDAIQIKSRDYGGPKHGGLFVTADFDLAKRFGGGAILEIKVRANNLHGTDYSGNTTKDRQKKGENFDWLKDKYPNSFRPHLSDTMLQQSEPQGLLIGLVSPKQITRVWIKEKGSWNEYTREQIVGKVTNSQYGKDTIVSDVGIDLSSPKIKLNDFLIAYSKQFKGRKTPEDILKVFQRRASAGEEQLERILDKLEDSPIGPLARKSLIKQIMDTI